MNRSLILIILGFFSLSFYHTGGWGFYAHRLINRMAVYTLPPEMMTFYKPNIDFIAEHAVDPDKRRYATSFEAIRHYIDLERWGTFPFIDLPRRWDAAVIRHTDLLWLTESEDTVLIDGEVIWGKYQSDDTITVDIDEHKLSISSDELLSFYNRFIIPHYYDDPWEVPCDSTKAFFDWPNDLSCFQILVADSLSGHGILPFHLVEAQAILTQAFANRDLNKILRFSSEIGHYIGDAHVPLHTTENYNGQLSDQLGIHAFWESRIPELFAESEYDFLVGKPIYINDPTTFYWDIVMTSHQYVDSVLQIEKNLSKSYPSDEQFCFEERFDVTIRTQCEAYTRAYHQRMAGMVEQRMQEAIRSIASAWYTAWIDGGQPDFGYEKIVADLSMSWDQIERADSKSNARVKKRVHE